MTDRWWYTLLVSVCLAIGLAGYQYSQANQTEQRADVEIMEGIHGDWLVYDQGRSTHLIRIPAITAIIWTEDGQRNEIQYGGGSLRNEMTRAQFIEQVEKYRTGKIRKLEEFAKVIDEID